jgi:hypothetical protein
MKKLLALLVISASANASQYVDHKGVGLQERVLMRGSDYIALCENAASAVKSGEIPDIDGCLLYTEGLRTGYAKATTEVVMQAALFNASPSGDDWEGALNSPFYDKLKSSMTRCEGGESTPAIAQKLSGFIAEKGKQADVMASIYYHFLKEEYPRCK